MTTWASRCSSSCCCSPSSPGRSRVTRLLRHRVRVRDRARRRPRPGHYRGQPAYPLPWAGLWSLPIARSAEPSRFIVFGVLVLAIALALWLAAPARSRLLLAARWGLGLLAVAAILTRPPTSYQAVNPVAAGYQPPADHAAGQPAAGVHHRRPVPAVPAARARSSWSSPTGATPGCCSRPTRLLLPDRGRLHQRVADAGQTPCRTRSRCSPTRAGRRTASSTDYLRSAGVGAIIVEQAWAEPWMQHLATSSACTAPRRAA